MAFDLLINLKGVQVRIPFETLDDLQAKLSSIDFSRLDEVLAATLGDLALETPKAKPGLEEIYVKDRTGLPQLLRVPKGEAKTVALALFASEPRHLSAGEIVKVTGVKDAARKYLSSGSYRRLFSRDAEGKYGLSHEGRKLVINEIVPSLSRGAKNGETPGTN